MPRDLDEKVALLAEAQDGCFARWQIADLATSGQVARRLAQGRWRRELQGIYSIAGASDSWRRKLRIGLLEGGRGAVVGQRSAAVLLGLPGFPASNVDITRPEIRTNSVRRQASQSRRTSLLPVSHTTEAQGFPVTTLARTLFDLAGLSSPVRRRRGWHYVHPQRVERAVDDASAQLGLQLESLVDVVNDLGKRGRPGTQLMRRIIEERSDGQYATESELEDLFLAVVAKYGLPVPARQRNLGDETNFIGRVDFVYEAERLVIELDGRKYHTALTDWERDKWRDLRLAASGFTTLRISWTQLTEHPDEIADLLRRVLRRSA